MKKYCVPVITCVLLLLAGICYSFVYRRDASQGVEISELSSRSEENAREKEGKENEIETLPSAGTASEEVSLEDRMIYVHLCGAVLHPGVYRVPEQSRVVDVITLAGGLLEASAGDYINQAEPVADGQRIYIPTREETADRSAEEYYARNSAAPGKEASANQMVNVNTAGKEELMKLPGIGEAKAASIIEYRQANGEFRAIEDLMKIPGIKDGLFHKISSYITVK